MRPRLVERPAPEIEALPRYRAERSWLATADGVMAFVFATDRGLIRVELDKDLAAILTRRIPEPLLRVMGLPPMSRCDEGGER